MVAKKHKVDEKNTEGEKPLDQSIPPADSEGTAEVPAVIPEEEISQLRSELDQALVKADDYLTGWQRERAEFINWQN